MKDIFKNLSDEQQKAYMAFVESISVPETPIMNDITERFHNKLIQQVRDEFGRLEAHINLLAHSETDIKDLKWGITCLSKNDETLGEKLQAFINYFHNNQVKLENSIDLLQSNQRFYFQELKKKEGTSEIIAKLSNQLDVYHNLICKKLDLTDEEKVELDNVVLTSEQLFEKRYNLPPIYFVKIRYLVRNCYNAVRIRNSLESNYHNVYWEGELAESIPDPIIYIGDLVTRSEADLLRIANFGPKSLEELRHPLKENNLTFNVNLPNWAHERANEIYAANIQFIESIKLND